MTGKFNEPISMPLVWPNEPFINKKFTQSIAPTTLKLSTVFIFLGLFLFNFAYKPNRSTTFNCQMNTSCAHLYFSNNTLELNYWDQWFILPAEPFQYTRSRAYVCGEFLRFFLLINNWKRFLLISLNDFIRNHLLKYLEKSNFLLCCRFLHFQQ